ncbi:hypothetical protein JW905_04160 [bacterium]|nr:hypothetical protein [candidate division CSSED10-310 bacterium]
MHLLHELSESVEGGPRVLVTIVAATGHTPRKAGARMLRYADGTATGTIGGGILEVKTLEIATEIMRIGGTRLVRFELTEDAAEDVDMICGGCLTLFIEKIDDPDIDSDRAHG